MKLAFDRYHNYAELSSILRELEEAHPELVRVSSIGRSHEGRELWVATVTNHRTGAAHEKPAVLVDGNIHSMELTATEVALHHIASMVQGYGVDPDVTRCLDTRAFYVVPRLNPDGAEQALSSTPRFIRSSVRPYPFDELPTEGLSVRDIDGDGRILSMRIRCDNGRWKKHPDDERVMVLRDPTESGGEYFRILPEGEMVSYDGTSIRAAPIRERLDLNRNWPWNWRREHEQPGAGPFPLSEPETHAMAKFIADHPNVFTWIAGHTFSGVLLRPGFTESDDELPYEDLQHYVRVGRRGTELTGYPAISVFHDFRINKRQEIYGSTEWGYKNFGIYVWVPEYWAPHRAAGVQVENYATWLFDHAADDDKRMVAWSDEFLGEVGFSNWRPFAHPQLGDVEIGGWDPLRNLYNPPEALLAREVAPFSRWFVWQCLMSPRLELSRIVAKRLSGSHWLVQATVCNSGYLPTYCSIQALQAQAVREVIAEITVPEGAQLLQGRSRVTLGQLGGRAFKAAMLVAPDIEDVTDDRANVEWVIECAAGAEVAVVVRHERAGTTRGTVRLD